MENPMHFEQHALEYAAGRPPYPPALWMRLRELGMLTAGSRAVDLGAGSGQATVPLLESGLHVTAVEPGPRLASELRRTCPAAVVIESTAERADLPAESFDLAVAATSLHWLDLTVVLPKVNRALVRHGRFAVWRTAFGDPAAPSSPFRRCVAEIVARSDRPPREVPDELATDTWVHRLTESGLFRTDTVDHIRWSIRLNVEQVRALFTTFSDWSPSEVDDVAAAADELGGSVIEHYVTPLITLTAV